VALGKPVIGNGLRDGRNAWLNFTVASFLLGNDGRSYLAFTYSPGDSTNDYPLYHLDLGTASGSCKANARRRPTIVRLRDVAPAGVL
jgi:hypothetical protein